MPYRAQAPGRTLFAVMKAASVTRRILHAACLPESTQATTFPGSIDWKDVVDRAWQLGIVSPLNDFVRRHLSTAPEETRQRLAALHLRQAAEAVMVHEQLREVVSALRDDGIETIVLKGAALALGVYRNVAARPMRDLDLLLHADQLAAAEAVLTEQGYRPDEFYRPRAWWIEHHHHLIPLVRHGRPVPVELHRDLVPPWSGIVTDLPGLWARSEVVSIGGIPARVLSHGDLLLHLCQHLDRLVGKLGSVRDLAEVIRQKNEIDWSWLVAAAAESGSASRAYCALKMAREVAGAPVPAAALDSLRRAAGFSVVEDLALETIAERALTWTHDGGIQAALLADLGSALLGGKGMVARLSSATGNLWERAAAGRRRSAAQPAAT